MDNSKSSPRLERIKNELADSIETNITETGKSIISALISDAKSWLMCTYEQWKKSHSLKPKYEELQKYIEISNENVQIGMDKKKLLLCGLCENWDIRKSKHKKF